MATRFSNTLFPDATTDANFQAWAQFIEDTLVTTGGWVYVSQTGDTAPSALTHPTATSQKKGFRVYRMNDSLQATYPVYMRLDFGSSAASGVIAPGVWVTVGTGVNGSGTITGVLFTPLATATFGATGTNSTSQACNSYGSASPSRCTIGLFITSANSNYSATWGIERTKDATGADTGDGLIMIYRDAANVSNGIGMTKCKYMIYAGGSQPTEEDGLTYILTSQNPSNTFSGDVGLGVVIPFRGTAQQPGVNFLICNVNDISNEGNLQISLYGSMRTYQHMNNQSVSKAFAGTRVNDANARFLMRYD